MGFVAGLEKCPIEVEHALIDLEQEEPDGVVCMAQLHQQGKGMDCTSKACRRWGQRVHDLFPENCESSLWLVLDYIDGQYTLRPMTKAYHAALAKKECDWDFE